MAKNNKISSAYGAAINKRVPIMLGLIGIILTLTVVGLFTNTYFSNKPNPLFEKENNESITIKHTSIDWLNENKFFIEDFYMSKFYLEDQDEDDNYYDVESGEIKFKIVLGNKRDDNIVGDNVSISTTACYNWANQSFATSTTKSFKSSSEYNITGIDATFDKKPFFFTNVDLRKDVYFITTFQLTEIIDGENKIMLYVVEHDFDDLKRTGVGTDGTSFTK